MVRLKPPHYKKKIIPFFPHFITNEKEYKKVIRISGMPA
jgi:hypothetical protein